MLSKSTINTFYHLWVKHKTVKVVQLNHAKQRESSNFQNNKLKLKKWTLYSVLVDSWSQSVATPRLEMAKFWIIAPTELVVTIPQKLLIMEFESCFVWYS